MINTITDIWNSSVEMANKNTNLVVLVFSLTILIILTKYIYEKHREREGFGLSDIGDLFDSIGKIFSLIPQIFSMIGQLATTLFDFIDLFTCPFKILFNLPKCLAFYGLDVLFLAVWYIVWAIVFIFFFCPLWIGTTVVCFCLSNWNICWRITPNDICPSKHSFFNFVENMYRTLAGGKFLYRDGGDLSTCYCLPPIRMAMNPLTYYRMLGAGGGDGASASTVIAVFIIGAMATLHYAQLK